MKERSLAEELLVWLLPFIVGVSSFISLSTYLMARSIVTTQLREGVATAALTASAQVQRLWEQRRNDLISIGHSPLFRDYQMNREFGLEQEAEAYRREIEGMLLGVSRRTGAFPRLRLLSTDGRELCRIQDDRVVKPGSAKDLAVAAATRRASPGRPVPSAMRRVDWHSWPIVPWTTALTDGAGRKTALVLSADASFGPIYDLLARCQIGESGRARIGPRGELVNGMPGLEVGHAVTATAAVPGTPWSVIVAVDRDEFIRPLSFIGMGTLCLAIAAALVLGVGLRRQLQVLLEPIRRLAEAARAFADGKLEARVAVGPPREVAQLGQAFNVMAESLAQRTDDLMRRVRELTALHRMNDAALRQLGRSAIAQACLDAVLRGLGIGRGALFWVDEPQSELIGECANDDHAGPGTALRGCRLPLTAGSLWSEALERRQPAVRAGEAPPTGLEHSGWASFVAGPVTVAGRVVAVMGVDGGMSPSAELLRGLALFCGSMGLALENARLLEQTAASEARYRAAIENSPHAVIGLDQTMRVTLWNRRAEALFGYQPSEAAGRTLSFLFDQRDYDGLRRQVETAGSVRQAEVQGRARDGRVLDLNVSWTGQSAGAQFEWFIVIQDETEKKRLQAQLIQAEKLSAVGTLIAGVAHELNNPITAVTGFAEVFKDLPASLDERADLCMMYASAMRCHDIVKGLLSYARQGQPTRRRIAVSELLQATVGLIEYRLVRSEGIELKVEVESGVPDVAGDFSRLQQVFVNLLSNAGDALSGHGRRKAILLRASLQGGGLRVNVEDTGPGVPEELEARIFDPFFTTKPAGQGTGLGLSISRQIVEEHGGSLAYERRPGGGARFFVLLPACPQDVCEPEAARESLAALPGRSVLVVDDEPEVAQLMTRLLSDDGLAVTAVIDIASAREALRRASWDLVVADIDLGPVKGIDLLDEARAKGEAPPFLFVTGDVLNQHLRREVSKRGAPLLGKPFLRTEFLRAVRRALTVRREG